MSTQQESNNQVPPSKNEQLQINLSEHNTLAINFVNYEGTSLVTLEFDRELSTGKPCMTIGRATSEGLTLLQMDFPATESFPV
jgi:hypothetical protein